MPTVWDADTCRALVVRAQSLTPAHTARWGKFSASGMLAHVNDAARMALGELPVAAKAPPFLKWSPVRYLLIHLLPMPKGAPTAPELLARTSAADLVKEQQAFAAIFGALSDATTLQPRHPAFGAMTRDDWGVLIHKHTDHHLRQFGV